jgi:general stress protein CsbA
MARCRRCGARNPSYEPGTAEPWLSPGSGFFTFRGRAGPIAKILGVILLVGVVADELYHDYWTWQRTGYESRFLFPLLLVVLGAVFFASQWLLTFVDVRQSRKKQDTLHAPEHTPGEPPDSTPRP